MEVASPWPACWSSMCQMNFGLLMRYLFRSATAPDKAYATTVGQHSSPERRIPNTAGVHNAAPTPNMRVVSSRSR